MPGGWRARGRHTGGDLVGSGSRCLGAIPGAGERYLSSVGPGCSFGSLDPAQKLLSERCVSIVLFVHVTLLQLRHGQFDKIEKGFACNSVAN
jgi:hypothetical protein